MGHLTSLDFAVFGVYIGAVLALGVWAVRRGVQTKRDYFLAGDKLSWWMIGGSILAANISSHHFVGIMGVAYKRGFVAFSICWPSVFYCFSSLLFVFLPFYLRNGFYTMPEFLNRRYGTAARTAFGALILLTYVFVEIAAVLCMGAIAVHALLGISMFMVHRRPGRADQHLYDHRRTAGGGVDRNVPARGAVGGRTVPDGHHGPCRGRLVGGDEPLQRVALALPRHGPRLPLDHLDRRQPGHRDFLRLRQSVHRAAGLGRQKRMACPHGRRPRHVLDAGHAAGLHRARPAGAPALPSFQCPDDAFPTLVQNLLPTGMVGLVMAGLVAAVMSHISGAINSCVTIACMDFYLPYIRKNASEAQCVRFGKITGVVIVAAAVGRGDVHDPIAAADLPYPAQRLRLLRARHHHDLFAGHPLEEDHPRRAWRPAS